MMAKIVPLDQCFAMCLPFDNATQEPKGVVVRMTDFNTEPDGKLLIQIRGERFCRLSQLSQDDDRLWHADVSELDEPSVPWRPDLIAGVVRVYQGLRQHPDVLSLALPMELPQESALNWLVTLLPFAPSDRQLLLNCEHSGQRAELLTRWVQIDDGED